MMSPPPLGPWVCNCDPHCLGHQSQVPHLTCFDTFWPYASNIS